jgi:hypothetical protein
LNFSFSVLPKGTLDEEIKRTILAPSFFEEGEREDLSMYLLLETKSDLYRLSEGSYLSSSDSSAHSRMSNEGKNKYRSRESSRIENNKALRFSLMSIGSHMQIDPEMKSRQINKAAVTQSKDQLE